MTTSAGILPFRSMPTLAVLIAHPGGPFWAGKEAGAWSIVKGQVEPGEGLLTAAQREFAEETGLPVPTGPFIELGEVTQRAGKTVHVWAVEADVDDAAFRPGTITIVVGGRELVIPEIDRISWVAPGEARRLLNPAQAVFIDRLLHRRCSSEKPGETVPDRSEGDDPDDGPTGEDGTDDASGGGAE